MGSYGPAQIYIPEYVERKSTLIHFTGYTAKGTLGRKLMDAQQGEVTEISGIMVTKNATVKNTIEYSAHAKADEMIDFLNQFTNLRFVILNHGEEQTKLRFAERVMKQTNAKHVGILNREYFFRVNPYGYVKSMTTKFE